MKEQAAKDRKEYDEKMQEASGIISEISGRVKEVKVKYERLNRLTYKFATDYYPPFRSQRGYGNEIYG